MDDKDRGLYHKYDVTRTDQSIKHADCDYFVLDLTHDEFATAAILAYADAAEQDGYHELASDLRNKVWM